jgi:hypothetical protein
MSLYQIVIAGFVILFLEVWWTTSGIVAWAETLRDGLERVLKQNGQIESKLIGIERTLAAIQRQLPDWLSN